MGLTEDTGTVTFLKQTEQKRQKAGDSVCEQEGKKTGRKCIQMPREQFSSTLEQWVDSVCVKPFLYIPPMK